MAGKGGIELCEMSNSFCYTVDKKTLLYYLIRLLILRVNQKGSHLVNLLR